MKKLLILTVIATLTIVSSSESILYEGDGNIVPRKFGGNRHLPH